jgi:hypothetical protein
MQLKITMQVFRLLRQWLESTVLWDVAACSLLQVYRRFGIINCLRPQGWRQERKQASKISRSWENGWCRCAGLGTPTEPLGAKRIVLLCFWHIWSVTFVSSVAQDHSLDLLCIPDLVSALWRVFTVMIGPERSWCHPDIYCDMAPEGPKSLNRDRSRLRDYGSRFHGNAELLLWQGPEAIVRVNYKPILSSERTPIARNPQLSNRKQKSGHGLQMGARYQDRLADWLSVVI